MIQGQKRSFTQGDYYVKYRQVVIFRILRKPENALVSQIRIPENAPIIPNPEYR